MLSTLLAWRVARTLLITISVFAASWPAAVAADGSGDVVGVVTNGTFGGTVPAGLPVTLTKYVSGVAVETLATEAGDDGKFAFADLETVPRVVYQVHVEHLATRFTGDLFSLSDSRPAEVGVTIYEVTDADPGIEIARHVVVYTPEADKTVRALEIVTLTNPSDRAFVPAQDAANQLSLPLPPGAFDFVVMLGFDPEQVEFVGNRVAIERALSPASNQISFAYSFPWRLDGIDIPRRAPFRTVELVIMAPAGDLSVVADRIERTVETTIEGRDLWVWRNVEPLAAGADFSLTVIDPSPSMASRISAVTSGQWGLASIAVALGFLLVYSAIRFGRSGLGPGRLSSEDRAGALLELIAGSGERSENEAERAAWEAELIQILESDDQLAKKVLGVSDIAD